MNLAEQIKNEIRQDNPIDYDGMTKAVQKIFTECPRANIGVHPRPRKDMDYGQGIESGYYYISIPEEWTIDIENWAEENGFKVERGKTVFYIRLV